MNKPVTMYASAWCGYCHRARVLLQAKGVELEEFTIDGNPELRNEMIDRTGRHTVPQIFIGKLHIGGSDELVELERMGKLDALLAADTTAA
jgi:glutaredoxin 3